MSIPALDGVTSAKTGFIQTDTVSLLCELHDDGVESHHGSISDIYRRPTSTMIRTEPGTGVVIESVLANLGPDNLANFTDAFTRELDFLFRFWSPDHDAPDRDELNLDDCTDTEAECLQTILAHGNNGDFPEQLWYTYLRGAFRDTKYGDKRIELIDNESRTFSEGTYDSQAANYVPDDRYIEESHFHLGTATVETEEGDRTVGGLWFQYTDLDDHQKEIPLVYASDGLWLLYAHDVEYGDSEYTDNLTDAFRDAVTAAVTTGNADTEQLTDGEAIIVETLIDTDISDTRTETLLQTLQE